MVKRGRLGADARCIIGKVGAKAIIVLVVMLRKSVAKLRQIFVCELPVARIQEKLTGSNLPFAKACQRLGKLDKMYVAAEPVQKRPCDEHPDVCSSGFRRQIRGEVTAGVPRCIIIL